jgi:hypothetical protein
MLLLLCLVRHDAIGLSLMFEKELLHLVRLSL